LLNTIIAERLPNLSFNPSYNIVTNLIVF